MKTTTNVIITFTQDEIKSIIREMISFSSIDDTNKVKHLKTVIRDIIDSDKSLINRFEVKLEK